MQSLSQGIVLCAVELTGIELISTRVDIKKYHMNIVCMEPGFEKWFKKKKKKRKRNSNVMSFRITLGEKLCEIVQLIS